jgi:hypothetical protein
MNYIDSVRSLTVRVIQFFVLNLLKNVFIRFATSAFFGFPPFFLPSRPDVFFSF